MPWDEQVLFSLLLATMAGRRPLIHPRSSDEGCVVSATVRAGEIRCDMTSTQEGERFEDIRAGVDTELQIAGGCRRACAAAVFPRLSLGHGAAGS